jgi:hypothetical protein
MTIPQSPRELISRWHKRAREIQHSQYETGKKLRSKNKYFGVAVLTINIIVASSIFISIKAKFSVSDNSVKRGPNFRQQRKQNIILQLFNG